MIGLEFFVQNAVKASAILMAAFAIVWALGGRPAALRHFVWSAVLATLLLLPALIAMTPKWGWRAMPEGQTTAATVEAGTPAGHPVARGVAMHAYLLALAWAAGFLMVAVRFALSAARTAGMVRRATPAALTDGMGIGTRARLLESREAPMPLAWGIRNPAVVLPVEARDWPAGRLRAVVLHESMHVERRDLLAQAVGQAACALFWFHPLAWIAARRLRKERERACDDAVLLRGIAPHDYAAHLLELVRELAARKAQWTAAPGMAERSDLEARVRALLDRRRSRQPLSRRAALGVSAAALAVLLPLAALTTYAQAARGGLAGVVQDPSGARIPGVTIIARNLDGSNQERTVSNEAGEYRFAAIPPGHYELEFQAKGFAVQKVPVLLTAGSVARVDATPDVGGASESITITGQKPAAALPASVSSTTVAPRRIRVGGNVKPLRLLQQAKPVYPPDAQQQGVEGTVLIKAVVSRTGDVLNPSVINTAIDPRLAEAALDAVGKWHYEPTLLDGEAVETAVTITLDFKLGQ